MPSDIRLASRSSAEPSLTAGIEFVTSEYPPGLEMAPHVDGSPRVSIVLAGLVLESGPAGDTLAGPGDVVFKPADVRHANRFGPAPARIFSICVARKRSDDDDNGGYAGLPSAIRDYGWRRGDDACSAMWTLARSLARPDVRPGLEVEEALLGLRAALDGEPLRRRGSAACLIRACRFIEERCDEALRVAGIAEACGVHPVSLTRLFRRRIGCTVSDFVQRARLRRAARLLTAGDLSLAQVAAAAGFADQAHLGREFRARVGLTPGAYRARRASPVRNSAREAARV